MMGLTKRQADVLRFVAGYQERFERSPSYREITRGLQINAISRIFDMVMALEERGAVRAPPGKQRGIEVLRPIAVPRAPDGEPLYFVRIGEVG
jgi:SOS-response transcriptional repressor LexA